MAWAAAFAFEHTSSAVLSVRLFIVVGTEHLVRACSWQTGVDLMWTAPRCLVALFGVMQPRVRMPLTQRLFHIVASFALARDPQGGTMSFDAPAPTHGRSRSRTMTPMSNGAHPSDRAPGGLARGVLEQYDTCIMARFIRSAPVLGTFKRGAAGLAFASEVTRAAVAVLLAVCPLPPATAHADTVARNTPSVVSGSVVSGTPGGSHATSASASAIRSDARVWTCQALAVVSAHVRAQRSWSGLHQEAAHAILSLVSRVIQLTEVYGTRVAVRFRFLFLGCCSAFVLGRVARQGWLGWGTARCLTLAWMCLPGSGGVIFKRFYVP